MRFANFLTFVLVSLQLIVLSNGQTCRSYIPFSFDVSEQIQPAKFTTLKQFLMNPFLSNLFPYDLQPAPFSVYAQDNFPFRRPNNVTDVIDSIWSINQHATNISYVISALKYFVDINVIQSGAVDGYHVNTIIFAGAPLHSSYVNDAQNYTNYLTANGNTLTIVLVNTNINPSNYYKIHGLNLVYWSNSTTMMTNIWNILKCSVIPTQTPPPLPTTTTTTTRRTTPSSGVSTCLSHIPFAYDVSLSLTPDLYSAEEQFVLYSLLSLIFPQNIQPSWFAIFATSSFFPRNRPLTIANIVDFVNIYPQLSAATADIVDVLKHLQARNVTKETDGLPVNTVILTGSALPSANVQDLILLAENYTMSGNTLTVVFTNPLVDQKNYDAVTLVSEMNLVQYSSNPSKMASDLRMLMNCK